MDHSVIAGQVPVKRRTITAGISDAGRLRPWLIAGASAVLVGCGGGGGGGGPVTNVPAPPTAFIATSVDSALDYGVDNGLDGIWAYVDDGSPSPQFKTAGDRDRATLAPADPTDLFKIASISKMFIAVATTKLVATGTVRLDDTLAFWLPDLESRIANADSITVQDLLRHRSGVPDFDSQPGFSWQNAHTDVDAVLGLVLDRPADFAPDARFEYSNTNYLLIGRIIDTALGYHHHQFVQNEILSPLGMVSTYSLLGDTDAALLAAGYWGGVDRTGQDYVVPGGSMVSTARDVGVFMRALATGSLLTPDERTIYESLFAGFGHSGWLPGYQSEARYFGDFDTVLVLFVNETGGNSEALKDEVFQSLVDYLRGR